MNMAILNNPVMENPDQDKETGIPMYKYGISLVVLFVLTALVIWTGVLLKRPDILPIQNVRIEGEFRQLHPDHLQATVVDTVRGGFFNVNVDVIKSVLLNDPWVYQVSVRRIWPDTITVSISERVAVARWGVSGLLSVQGEYFDPGAYNAPDNLPVLYGPEDSHEQVLEYFQLFSELLSRSGLTITRLEMNERRSWLAVLSNGPQLILGRTDVQERMGRFLILVNSPLKTYLQKIDAVDLRYTNGFAVRWKADHRDEDQTGLENHG